ncbi:MAG: aminotransferase class V-fold PLP-dependent enzyme [Clostridia bacterium]|nr:aminotransferase class V-fold PLP-dependent enzyme [Clostridia bacterium]
MNTPIIDFLEKYNKNNPARFHMPGHKGKILGCEKDITEIVGADNLYDANGIIGESEKNLSSLFGTNFSVYSTEGSSLSIRTMLALIKKIASERGEKPHVLATRNAHSSFLYGVALLDIEIEWITQENTCFFATNIDEISVEEKLRAMEIKPTALFITSPDYLGNIAPVEKIAKVCKKYGVLLAVDNAHGAYLNFLSSNIHPISLGADMCCDSAHKTLPTLTGGAYLHLGKGFNYFTKHEVKNIMKMFASTSPSYLILASLDNTNKYLFENKDLYEKCAKRVEKVKETCIFLGFSLVGNEPLKITLDAKSFGYLGDENAEYLKEKNIYVEYFDSDYIVLMFTPLNSEEDFNRLENALSLLQRKGPIKKKVFNSINPIKKMSIKEALFSSQETIEIDSAKGRILASVNLSCPPAVPILYSGEVIDDNAIEIMKYYNIDKCSVVKE